MARRLRLAVAGCAAVAVGLAGCSSPSANNAGTDGTTTGKIGTQKQTTDKDAKGPAPEVPGAQKGGTLTVYAESNPNTLDPTDIYYTDSNEIGKLVFRTPTQYAVRDGVPVLVPDLTDLGTASADKLTWTFKFKTGLKYEDGAEIKVDDLAYAIKRSFAHDIYVNGPVYQQEYFKDGDKYKGPYKDGLTYSGVATPAADTLVINLRKPFPDLPFYLAFPMFTPIPQAKDTRVDYKNKPVASGPYAFDTYTPGTQLKLKRNLNWDAASDPVRHQYPDAWDFKWGGELIATQQKVLNSNGPDATAISYDNVDSSLIPQLQGDKKAQLVTGDSPCNAVVQLDSRYIPLEVRKAIAKAYPYDQAFQAAGLNDINAERSSTVLPPSVPGYQKYTPLPDLAGVGKGDPAGAKAMLAAAGKLGFELSWYYDNTKPIPQQVNQIRTTAFEAAGFKVKAIGVATADLRTRLGDYDAKVNMGQSPSGWCSDWPTGSSWFPVLFKTSSIAGGSSWGMLSDKALDAEIDAVASLPAEEATPKWAALDQKILNLYIALPRYYDKMAVVQGTKVGGTVADPNKGLPLFHDMFVKP